MPTRERPAAEVHALLEDPPPPVPVAGDRHEEVDIAHVQDALLHPAVADDGELEVLGRGAALLQPAPRLLHEARERGRALDPAAHRVMQLRLGGERFDQRARLAGQHAHEERHQLHPPAARVLPDARERRRGEQLGQPGHRYACSASRATLRASTALTESANALANTRLPTVPRTRPRNRPLRFLPSRTTTYSMSVVPSGRRANRYVWPERPPQVLESIVRATTRSG